MRCVILDDYQDVARSYADWSVLDGVSVEAVHEHEGQEEDGRGQGDGEELVGPLRARGDEGVDDRSRHRKHYEHGQDVERHRCHSR